MKPMQVIIMAILMTCAPATGWSAEASPQVRAEAALARARAHLDEAFKALQDAGNIMYQDKVPAIQEKSKLLLEGIMDQAQGVLNDLQKQLKDQLHPPTSPPPPGYLPPGENNSPPPGGRDRFI